MLVGARVVLGLLGSKDPTVAFSAWVAIGAAVLVAIVLGIIYTIREFRRRRDEDEPDEWKEFR